MPKQPVAVIAMAFLAAACAVQTTALATVFVMPKELVEYGKKQGCNPVDDFFDRDGPVEPPFAYGLDSEDDSSSAVFWCQFPGVASGTTSLVLKLSGNVGFADCPRRIDWWNPPGGLKVITKQNIDLGRYRFIASPESSSPAATIPTGRVIVGSYDGVSAEFVCHERRWLFAISH